MTSEQKQVHAARCPCKGTDDYCQCQNVPDARAFGEKIVTETELLLELEAAFLVSLAANNLPPDIAELLVRGNPMRGIPPRMIQKAIKAAVPHWDSCSAPWRPVYNATHPKVWGIETTDPAAMERGDEQIVAPCMPEHAARAIAEAYNARRAPDRSARDTLRQIRDRIGDLKNLKDQTVGDSRKWALDDIWTIAHNALLQIERTAHSSQRHSQD